MGYDGKRRKYEPYDIIARRSLAVNGEMLFEKINGFKYFGTELIANANNRKEIPLSS